MARPGKWYPCSPPSPPSNQPVVTRAPLSVNIASLCVRARTPAPHSYLAVFTSFRAADARRRDGAHQLSTPLAASRRTPHIGTARRYLPPHPTFEFKLARKPPESYNLNPVRRARPRILPAPLARRVFPRETGARPPPPAAPDPSRRENFEISSVGDRNTRCPSRNRRRRGLGEFVPRYPSPLVRLVETRVTSTACRASDCDYA